MDSTNMVSSFSGSSNSVMFVLSFELPNNFPRSIKTPDDIEAIAKMMRNEWELGQNTMPDIIDPSESKGIAIISTAKDEDAITRLENKKFDGLAGVANGMPLIVIFSHQPGDRQRFTLTHELGHLVLHG